MIPRMQTARTAIMFFTHTQLHADIDRLIHTYIYTYVNTHAHPQPHIYIPARMPTVTYSAAGESMLSLRSKHTANQALPQ